MGFPLKILTFSILSIDVQVQGIYEKIFYITKENLRSSLMMMMRNEHVLWTWVSKLWGTFTCFTHRNVLSIFYRNPIDIFSLKHVESAPAHGCAYVVKYMILINPILEL